MSIVEIDGHHIDISQIVAVSRIYVPHKTPCFDIYFKGGGMLSFIRKFENIDKSHAKIIKLWKEYQEKPKPHHPTK